MHRFFVRGQKAHPMPKRQGLTLVELLAVIAVMAVLLSVAVPVIRPALKDRKLRESARLINAYVAGVQARAAELGRPVGIVLTRGTTNARDAYQCTEIFTAEVPRPYAGDPSSTVSVLYGRLHSNQRNRFLISHIIISTIPWSVPRNCSL